MKWYRQAAEQGDANAMMWLVECYEKGLGVARSAEEAAKWRAEAEKADIEVGAST